MLCDLFMVPVYVRVARNKLRTRHIKSAIEVTTSATAPFTTQRLLIGQFLAAVDTLKLALKQTTRSGLFSPSPAILIHPVEMVEGGLSEVEELIFREVAVAAGASKVVVWTGSELDDLEVVAKLNKK